LKSLFIEKLIKVDNLFFLRNNKYKWILVLILLHDRKMSTKTDKREEKVPLLMNYHVIITKKITSSTLKVNNLLE